MGLELWLVRHGETSHSRDGLMAGWVDVPLTGRGEEQARALRSLLDGEAFDGVWSSDLQRAIASARLARGEPRVDRRLREISFGSLENEPWISIDERHRDALVRFAGFDAPDGETLEQVRERVDAFLAELPAGRHLVFSHGGVIRLLTREAGDDAFLPTGTLVVLDWPARQILRRLDNPVASPPPFARD
jgi:probable phosphoglycerate mutase